MTHRYSVAAHRPTFRASKSFERWGSTHCQLGHLRTEFKSAERVSTNRIRLAFLKRILWTCRLWITEYEFPKVHAVSEVISASWWPSIEPFLSHLPQWMVFLALIRNALASEFLTSAKFGNMFSNDLKAGTYKAQWDIHKAVPQATWGASVSLITVLGVVKCHPCPFNKDLLLQQWNAAQI